MTTSDSKPNSEGADQPDSERTVLGDFELLREIGRGGMGTVYEARQVSLQRTVALKVLAPNVASTPKAVSRFRREAQAAAKLHHTHIVPIFAQGEAEGSYFYAMELVGGASLNSVIGELRTKYRPQMNADQAETVAIAGHNSSTILGTPAPGRDEGNQSNPHDSGAKSTKASAFGAPELFHDVARHLADVADALEYAHVNGVIHRDIKPHNLLFGHDGRLRVSDFGLARLAEQPGVTMTGELLGSPLYMSPEQISGDPESVDHRTDIYSLGATMYEWLTLRPPYPGETRERVISKILSSEVRHPRVENPAVPLDLETICLKALERDLNRRYRNAAEMRDDLRRYMLSRPIHARRAGLTTRAARFLARHQIATLLSIAFVLGLVLVGALFAQRRTVKVEKEAAVKAQVEVEQAKQAAEKAQVEVEQVKQAALDAEADRKILHAAFNAVLPGGAALAERVTSTELPKIGLPAASSLGNLTRLIGTPSVIARRFVKEFFLSVVSPDWPGNMGEESAQVAKINQASERWLSGDIETAQRLLEEYFASLPAGDSDRQAVQMRAALNAMLGHFDAMHSDADSLLKGGGNPEGYIWRGLANLLLNRADSSLSDLTRGAAMGPVSPWVDVFRGLALVQADRTDEAKSLFEQVLQGKSATGNLLAAAHLGRAKAFIAEGDYAAALPELDEVLKSDPRNVDALTLRGESRYVTGDIVGAQADFREAINVAGYITELVLRSAAVMGAQNPAAGPVPTESGSTEIKSRHGTDTEGDSPPPLFDVLDPRRRQPRADLDKRRAQILAFSLGRACLTFP